MKLDKVGLTGRTELMTTFGAGGIFEAIQTDGTVLFLSSMQSTEAFVEKFSS